MSPVLNFNKEVEVEIFDDSPIYTIKNFYTNPNDILNLLDKTPAQLWKNWETPSYNGIHFTDQRHDFVYEGLTEITTFLSSICKQPVSQGNKIISNKLRFIDYDFNDYFNGYWAPHNDLGYTAIIYLNICGNTGTNLYKCIGKDNWDTPEHYQPWRPKKEYQVIKTLDAEFNKLVMFDGKKFLHGMSIEDDCFFTNYRLNQVIFFVDQK